MSFISRATVQRATSKPSRRSCPPDLAHAIDLEVVLEDAPDLGPQRLIPLGTRRAPLGIGPRGRRS
jgi:hypothetical protein